MLETTSDSGEPTVDMTLLERAKSNLLGAILTLNHELAEEWEQATEGSTLVFSPEVLTSDEKGEPLGVSTDIRHLSMSMEGVITMNHQSDPMKKSYGTKIVTTESQQTLDPALVAAAVRQLSSQEREALGDYFVPRAGKKAAAMLERMDKSHLFDELERCRNNTYLVIAGKRVTPL